MHLTRLIPMLALAALCTQAAGQETDPLASECAASETGFVDGIPCFSFGGIQYAARNGEGTEAAAIRGAIDGRKLADRSVPESALDLPDNRGTVVFVGETQRGNNTISVAGAIGAGASDGTVIVFRAPDSSAPDGLSVIIGAGREGRRLERGSGAVTWADITAKRWYIAVRAGDTWFLLN